MGQPRNGVVRIEWEGSAGTARGKKSAAPLKRNMFAWRRRPIPRVMQCPRQEIGLARRKKVQYGPPRILRAIPEETSHNEKAALERPGRQS